MLSGPDPIPLPGEVPPRRDGSIVGRILLLLVTISALGGLGVVWFAYRQGSSDPDPVESRVSDLPPDPRLAYTGPFQNVHPSVGYVGDAACAACHVEIAQTFAKHPMGQSTVPMKALADKQVYDKAHRNPFDALGQRHHVERKGERVWHVHSQVDDGKPVWENRREIHYVVGSGTRGFSYLHEIDGYVFQTAISFYTTKQIWDLSPGFVQVPAPGRPIQTACLYCHANHVREVPGYVNRYEKGVFTGLSIGCERCHGPGQKHVEAKERGEPPAETFDPSIVNPRHLPWQLRENVCEQCHLGGESRILRRGRGWFDYRPGMPLEEFLALFVKNPDLPGTHKAVSHVEQMRKSKCFQRSTGSRKMGCLTCHDPHHKEEPAQSVEHYRKRCLSCHQDKGCSVEVAVRRRKVPGDSCIVCHMPQAPAADVAHIALTDHSILRPGKESSDALPRGLGPDELPVILFHREQMKPDDPESRRDLGVGLMEMLRHGKVPALYRETVSMRALGLLEERLGKAPTDPKGWQARGDALLMMQRTDEARPMYERALEQMPKNEDMLDQLALLNQAQGRNQEAMRYWRQAVAVNPYNVGYRRGLGTLLAQVGDWAGAAEQAQAWLKMEAGSSAARQLWILSLLELGKREEARRAFEQLRKQKPANLADLEIWFRRRGG